MTDTTTAAAAATTTTTGAAADTGAASTASGATTDAGAAAATDTGAAKSTTDGAAKTGDTAAAVDWRAGITDPDGLEIAKRTASVNDLAKSAADLRKANGSMIRVPAADAKPEEVAKFRKAIGAGEKQEEYTAAVDIGREATEADKPVIDAVAKVMHANGVPLTAVKAVTKAVTELAVAQAQEADRVALGKRAEAETALKKELGADYDKHIEVAIRARNAFGGKELVDFLDNTIVQGQKLGDHPVLVKAFGNVGLRMGEGDFIGAVGTSQRESVQGQIDTIMLENPPGSTKYADPGVQKQLKALHEQLHGTGAAGAGFSRAL